MKAEFPILEFDEEREAVIEPAKIIKARDIPKRCIICFFRDVIDKVKRQLKAEALPPIVTEMGEIPVFSATHNGRSFAIAQSGVGAPLAAGILEEIIARGGHKFIVYRRTGVVAGCHLGR